MKKLFFPTLLIIGLFSFQAFAQIDDQTSPSEKNPKAMELIKQAIRLESANLMVSAINKYKEVLVLEPRDFAAMNSIAGLYGKLDDFVQEAIWAKKAIEANPKWFQSYINYGNSQGMQGKFDEAIKQYTKAGELAPKNPLPIFSLGVIAENQRDLKKALDLYKISVELDPKFEAGLFSAAAMHANLKQFAEAKVLLNQLLKINPNDQDARQMLAQIEKEKPNK